MVEVNEIIMNSLPSDFHVVLAEQTLNKLYLNNSKTINTILIIT